VLSLTTITSTAEEQSCLAVSIDWVHGVVALRGELDRDSAHHLVDAVRALAATTHSCWAVDTAEVTWCDAGGLRALAKARALAVDSGRELRLVRPSRCVERVVTLSGLDRLIADRVPPAVTVPPATGGAGGRTYPRSVPPRPDHPQLTRAPG
jgi:anti-sigma B factor antagonist